MNKDCKHCQKEFFSKFRTDRQQYAQFCSRGCFNSALSENRKQVDRECMQCGVVFTTKAIRLKSGRGKYCSRSCFSESKVGIPGYWSGKKRETPWMNGVNNPSVTHGVWNKGKKMPEKTGQNHPNWIMDRATLRTDRRQAYDGRYKDWMKQVRERDGWKCRIANDECLGRIETHHILPWREHAELRYEVNNGITLCHFHHPRAWEEEKRMQPVFEGLIKSTWSNAV